MHNLHDKKESLASRPIALEAKGDWLNTFRERLHNVDRNDGIDGGSKLMPLSTDVRLIRRLDNKLVIVGRFDEIDEIGELFSFRKKKKKQFNFFYN